MKNYLQLLAHFIKDPQSTGSIWPSSNSLSFAIRSLIMEFKRDYPRAIVVEAGPGTGAITKHISDLSTPFYAIERNAELIPILKEVCPGVTVIESDLEQSSIFSELSEPILLVSSLPILSLRDKDKESVVSFFKKLLRDGKIKGLIQYTYSFGDPLDFQDESIQAQRKKFILANIPPAFIWTFGKK